MRLVQMMASVMPRAGKEQLPILFIAVMMLVTACSQSVPSTSSADSTPVSVDSPSTSSSFSTATGAESAEQYLYLRAMEMGWSAALAAQNAESAEEWEGVRGQWEEAIALLNSIPQSSEQYGVAQQKIQEYIFYATVAQQRKDMLGGSQATPQPPKAECPAPIIEILSGTLSFGSEAEVLTISNSSALNVGVENFSITAWIKTASQGGIEVIVDKRIETSGPIQGYVFANYNGELLLQLADAGRGDGWTNYLSGVAIGDNQWHHVAVTVDRQSTEGIRWYLDGAEVGEPSNPTGRTGSLTNPSPLSIGRRSDHPSWPGYFRGDMADIKLFRENLSAPQVQQLAARCSL